MSRLSERVEIGYVARAHGVRGELRVVLHNPTSEALDAASAVWLGEERFELKHGRAVDGAWLLTLDGLDDRDRAEALKGRTLSVPREALGLEPGEFILMDLVGCHVFLPDGTRWGAIVDIDVGPQDRLVIHDGDNERLLPAVDAFMVEIDIEAGRVVVDPPEGLPEERIRPA
jgi:16S rRNA processing protein RimM